MIGFNKGIISQSNAQFEFGNALEFDGVNDYVNLSSNISLTGQFTLSFWVKYVDFTVQAIFAQSTNSNGYLAVSINDSSFRNNDVGGVNSDFVVPTMSAGTWYNIVTTRDASNNVRFYLNGVESSTGALVNSGVFNVNSLSNYNGGQFRTDATIDEIGILKGAAATPTQITSLYNGGIGNDFVEVMGTADLHYKLNESSPASTAVDSSGNGNDGTLNNFNTSTCWVAH